MMERVLRVSLKSLSKRHRKRRTRAKKVRPRLKGLSESMAEVRMPQVV